MAQRQKKLTKMEIARLRGVQKRLRKLPKGYQFDMGQWVAGAPKSEAKTMYNLPEGFCATAGCIAGTLLLNEGCVPTTEQDYWDKDRIVINTYEWKLSPAGRKVYLIEDLMERLLPNADTDAINRLTIPFDYPMEENTFWDRSHLGEHERTRAKNYTAEMAITAIDNFIAANGQMPETIVYIGDEDDEMEGDDY